MPGVEVIQGQRPAASEVSTAPTARYFVAGLTERGDTDKPVRLRSMGDYDRQLGAEVSYGALYSDLSAFFAEGGQEAFVARVVGTTPTKGFLVLTDRAGTPLATLRVEARSVGAWSTQVTVQVVDAAVTNRFSIIVALNGVQVSAYRDLDTPAAAVAAMVTDPYVAVTDQASATVAPQNNPAVIAATALSAGTDDRATVVAATYTTALARLGKEHGAGAVAIPGQAASAVGAGLLSHAKAHRRIALLAPARAQTLAQVRTDVATFRNNAAAEYGGYFWPWVQVVDSAGLTRTVSPEGFVAGRRAATILLTGPWTAPAGEAGRTRGAVVGLELELTKADVDALAVDRVNPVASVYGVRQLYGWRSLSMDARNWLFLSYRDVCNYVAELGERSLAEFVFRNVDARGHFYSEVNTALLDVVEPVAAADGLYAMLDPSDPDGILTLDPGYVVDAGANVNPPAQVAQGIVQAEVAIRPSPLAELIKLLLTKVSHDSAL